MGNNTDERDEIEGSGLPERGSEVAEQRHGDTNGPGPSSDDVDRFVATLRSLGAPDEAIAAVVHANQGLTDTDRGELEARVEVKRLLPPRPSSMPCDPDCSRSGIDQTDTADPGKVWRCDGCGATGTSDELDESHG